MIPSYLALALAADIPDRGVNMASLASAMEVPLEAAAREEDDMMRILVGECGWVD